MSAQSHPLASALPHAQRIHAQHALQAAIVRIGGEITAALEGERAVFITVMNGGMFFAAPLAFAIGCDLEFDYAQATRYGNATSGGTVEWMREPRAVMSGRTVILADDILDEGYTMQALRDYCIGKGAKRVLIAVLCVKRHDRRVEGLHADFVGVEVPDRYVFGCGLDYYGQARNLPDIYALAEAGDRDE